MTLRVPVPTSKSMTQRALVLAALAEGPSRIEAPLECDDSRHLRGVLEALGANIAWHGDAALVTPAPRPLRAPDRPVFCGNAGTTMRFSSALALLVEGELALDGDEHMRRRPIGPLGDALTALGVRVRYLARPGCPPIALARTGPVPERAPVDASLSSQYASALLLVGPHLPRGLSLELCGDAVVSRPYLDMTLAMMQRAGATAGWDGARSLRVEPGRYRDASTVIEVDWSAAAFVAAAARVVGAKLEPLGLAEPSRSLQGDAAIAALLARLYRDESDRDDSDRAELDVFDLTDTPDLIAPLAAAALFAARPTRISGAAHTRVKECDRVHVLARELRKLGAVVTEHDDGLNLEPLGPRRAATAGSRIELDPDDDHRMAMAFGVVALRRPEIAVKNPGCVSKSFPDFWSTLALIREHTPSPTLPLEGDGEVTPPLAD